MMGGYQVPGGGSGDDGYDEDGYDESQRAEILEATRDGPSDGTILTDLAPDLGADIDDDADDDDLAMDDEPKGIDRVQNAEDIAEDEVQDELDDDSLEDDELDDGEDVAINP